MLIFVLVYVFIIGLAIGSFINCFVWRIYKEESLWDRSYCPKCGKKIHWYDNIPVFSFLFLKAKCRNCKKNISWQYPLVEAVTACLFVLVFYFDYSRLMPHMDLGNIFLFNDLNFFLTLIRDWFIVFVAVAIFIYDLRWFIIPDIIILPAIFLVSILNVLLGANPLYLVVLFLAGGSFFLIQFAVSKGKWIGGGDVRLGAFMGVCLARFDYLILSILLSYWVGALISIYLLLSSKRKWTSKLPLGVFLTTGIMLTIFFGDSILRWYFSLI